MPHIPRAVCVPCKIEMRVSKNSVNVEMLLNTGKPYYIVEADEYRCSKCGYTALLGFGRGPLVSHYEPDYLKHEPDISAEFAP